MRLKIPEMFQKYMNSSMKNIQKYMKVSAMKSG